MNRDLLPVEQVDCHKCNPAAAHSTELCDFHEGEFAHRIAAEQSRTPISVPGDLKQRLDEYDRLVEEGYKLSGYTTGHGVGKVAPHRDRVAHSTRVAAARARILQLEAEKAELQGRLNAIQAAIEGFDGLSNAKLDELVAAEGGSTSIRQMASKFGVGMGRIRGSIRRLTNKGAADVG